MLERLSGRSINYIKGRGPSLIERVPQKYIDYFSGRILDHIVSFHHTRVVDRRFEELIKDGIPLAYGDHEGHFDAAGFVSVAKHFIKLSKSVGGHLAGLVAPMAKSWAEGQQGEDLKNSYDFFKEEGEKRGLTGIPATREKDGERYAMQRGSMEMLPFYRHLHKDKGIAILPEGSIQGGRLKDAEKRIIYGMQQVKNDNLIKLFDVIERIGGKKGLKPFYVPIAFYGSHNFVKSTEDPNDKPELTKRAYLSLALAAIGFGIPFVTLRIHARMLMPFTPGEIEKDLGTNWKEDPDRFNTYAMRKLIPGLPKNAWGDYSPENALPSRTIEVSSSSLYNTK